MTRKSQADPIDRVPHACALSTQRTADDLDRRFRGIQIASVQKFTPIMMLGNVVNATLFFWLALQSGLTAVAVPWFVFILVLAAMAIQSWRVGSRRDRRKGASPRVIRRAIINAALFGLAWGLAALMLYPEASRQGQTVVAVITGGMIYGGGFALSAIPAAMNAYLAPLVAGGLIALIRNLQPVDLILGIPLVVFSFIVHRAGVGYGHLLRSNFEDRERLADQSNVISLLLHDFEQGTSDWLWQMDADGRLRRGAERFAEALETTPEALEALDFRRVAVSGCQEDGCECRVLKEHLEGGVAFRDLEIRLVASSGRICWLRLSGHPLRDAEGTPAGFRGVASDISNAKEAERRIAYLARHDPLTGLLNRASFGEKLEAAFAAYRASCEEIGLLSIDLDGFKAVNDRRGHLIGDRLLVEVAHRIADVTGSGGIVARVGGDEFAVLLRGRDVTTARDLASRIIRSIGRPVALETYSLHVGASVGIAFAGGDIDHGESLLGAADIALYRAKAGAKNTARVFDAQMRANVRRRRDLQQDLHFAIERNELVLVYQPIVFAETGATGGFEALLRWRHPARGLVEPDDFIHLAEGGGTIHEIGRWVVREACRTAANLPDEVFVSVNISSEQFRSADLATEVDAALSTSGVRPRRLEAELTEGLLVEDPAELILQLVDLRDLGVSVVLDNFGTGSSSFGALTSFPFDRLKIDRALVAHCDVDVGIRSLVQAILAMSEALGLETTAEGVETARHAGVLRHLGCRLLQGRFYSHPLSRDELTTWLDREAAKARRSA